MEGKNKFDILGDQMMAALSFAKFKFAGEVELFDSVEGKTVSGKELFQKQGKRWFMRPESLPGDLCVKALGIDHKGIYLETAPILKKEVAAAITERRIPVRFQVNKFTDINKTTLVKLKPSRMVGEENKLAPRQLSIIEWSNLDDYQQELAIQSLDAIYSTSAYSTEGLLEEGAEAVSTVEVLTKSKLELRLDLMLQLQLEQRPILSLGIGILGDMRFELRAIMTLQQRILKMSPEELKEWTAEQAQTPEGAKKALNVFIFALAGKVKEACPERNLSWKQARFFARRLIRSKKH